MVKIKWTEKASGDLEAIHKYIARDSKVYTSRFIKSLISATIKLETMPFCGRIVPELESYGFREIVYYNYRIVYNKYHLGVNGWEGVKESLDELGRIRKTTLTIGGEKIDKITVLTKEQKEIIKKLDFEGKLLYDA